MKIHFKLIGNDMKTIRKYLIFQIFVFLFLSSIGSAVALQWSAYHIEWIVFGSFIAVSVVLFLNRSTRKDGVR
jgi:hypothetical protein